MLNLSALHAPIRSQLETALMEVLHSGKYINGPQVPAFESALATQLHVNHVIGVSSGTDALLATLMALGVQPGDRIITTPYTFFATAGAIARLGAIPVFADIVPGTFNLDTRQMEALVDDRTVGIVPVHLFGGAADMATICDIARRHQLWVLEDAAQALGGKVADGRQTGTPGTAGTFSFFPGKNLGAMGDAGAVATNDDGLANRIRAIRGHGASEKYFHEHIGGNFRLDTLQAALLNVKLPYLDAWNQHRREAALRYTAALATCSEIVCPTDSPGHVYNQYVIQFTTDKRNDVRDALLKKNIACAVYYPTPLHLQPAFRKLGYAAGDFPVAECASATTLALPVSPTITENEQMKVVKTILNELHT